jgi:hypothetical protein
MSDNSTAPSGRSTWLVLGALAMFGVVWWFLPAPQVADSQLTLPVVEIRLPPKTQPPEAQANPTTTVPKAPVFGFVRPPATPKTPQVQGPSKGSFMANPKPRNVLPNWNLLARLDDLDRHMIAFDAEEADWMDLQGFPTIEEVNSIDPDSLEKYSERPNVNLRAMALHAAILKTRGNPAWKSKAGSAALMGSIFGNRLLLDDLMLEKFSMHRDKMLVHRVLLGKMLGDSYFPGLIAADGHLRWESYKIMSNFEITLHAFHVTIPHFRQQAGLPPLQVVQRPGWRSLEKFERALRGELVFSK